MLNKIFALGVLVFLAACATSAPKTFSGQFTPPPANSRVLVMTPDVQLSVLGAAGLAEPRQDWSISGRDNLAQAIAAYVQAKSHSTNALDPTTAMEGRVGQIIRLHDAVGSSILAINYGFVSVPTRNDNFEWTLGEGVRELGAAHNADYALFVRGQGTYSSGARMALAVLSLSATGAGQTVFSSLVDLRTGNVIWFNNVIAAPSQDMRTPEGAASLAATLMQDAPL